MLAGLQAGEHRRAESRNLRICVQFEEAVSARSEFEDRCQSSVETSKCTRVRMLERLHTGGNPTRELLNVLRNVPPSITVTCGSSAESQPTSVRLPEPGKPRSAAIMRSPGVVKSG